MRNTEDTPRDQLDYTCDVLRNRAEEYQWAIQYMRTPDFDRLARLRLARDLAAVECVSVLAMWCASSRSVPDARGGRLQSPRTRRALDGAAERVLKDPT